MLATSLVLTLVAAEPTAEDLLARAEAILSPEQFESDLTMTLSRFDGGELNVAMHMFKSGDDLCRVRVLSPSAQRGAEVLRKGDETWRYVPRTKRAVRGSSTELLHSGDFSSADLITTKLSKDYVPTLVRATDDDYELLLKAKSDRAASGSIEYLLRKKDAMPLSQKFYTAAGDLVRTVEFYDPKTFGDHLYPTRMVMWSQQKPQQRSQIQVNALSVKSELSPGLFRVAALGEASASDQRSCFRGAASRTRRPGSALRAQPRG
jgi:outer membrane lipoprotein-sorting protein